MLNQQDFIAKFREEALERLQRLNEGYIQLELGGVSEDLISELMREAHTLKGSSRMVGLTSISELAHRLEDIFLAIRDGKLQPKDRVSELIFQFLDAMLDLTEKGENDDEFVNRLLSVSEEVAQKDVYEQNVNKKTNNHKEPILDELKKSRKDSAEEEIKAHQMSTIRVRASQIDDQLNLVGESVIIANRLINNTNDLKVLSKKIKLLNELWSQVREKFVQSSSDRYQAEQIRSFDSIVRSIVEEARIIGDFVETIAKLDFVLNDLHQRSMELRMLPASYIFSLFPRAVRDMAKEFSKKIELKIEGEDTLIDKRVLEEIYDPLIHILRNAVDHGIEMPEERVALGKPETGTIALSARQEGDRIVITVSDDGRGIDPDLIKRIALKKGLITEAEAKTLSEKETIYLIFKPGFSSKATTTETSGRGIGMDVVKLHIEEKLKGHVEIETEKGKGTTFILTLPLTLAVVRCLLIKTAGMLFAVPTGNVQETLIFEDKDIVISGGERQLKLRNEFLPFVKLANVLGMKGIYEGNLALIVNMAGKTIAYEVEEIVDEIPVVIKPIDEVINKSRLFAGATILGSGEIVLILNMAELVRSTNATTFIERRRREKIIKASGRRPRILVVEDSLTTRELEISLLKAAGYEVDGARDGYEAYELLRDRKYDLVLTDIQMPRMNGYELIRRVKRDERLKNIPMVVVSSKSSPEEIEIGLNAGADAYITKSDFQKENLLSLIARLVNSN
jgi:chemotaxis protein histidine kinase CheA/ActR/RegA family two-component response regulator